MSKYRNKRTNGYASKREAARAQELKILERAGKISGLSEQVPFLLVPGYPGQRPVRYVADFVFWQDGVEIVEDCKGFRTEVFKLKKKLMKHVHGIDVREI